LSIASGDTTTSNSSPEATRLAASTADRLSDTRPDAARTRATGEPRGSPSTDAVILGIGGAHCFSIFRATSCRLAFS
jgi:hypothetical protein